MAGQQHVHHHYHYVKSEPDVPFWQVCVVIIMVIFLGWIIAAIVTGYFWLFVALLAYYIGLPAAIGYGAYYGIRHLRAKAKEADAHHSQLIRDADAQHRKFLSGDAAGLFGNYPPAY